MAHSKVTPALTTVVKKKKPSNTRNGFIVKKQRKVAVFRSSLPISNHNDHLEKRSEICEPSMLININSLSFYKFSFILQSHSLVSDAMFQLFLI